MHIAQRIVAALTIGLLSLYAQRPVPDSSHPAVTRSASVVFVPISEDLYQRASDGANVQSALKDLLESSKPKTLPKGTLYVPFFQNANDPGSFVTTPNGDYILVLLKDGRHGMIPKNAYAESLTTALPLAETTWVDTATGLRWALHDNGSNVNWEEARSYCQRLNLSGLGGWRLPDTSELKGIFGIFKEATQSNLKGGIELTGA